MLTQPEVNIRLGAYYVRMLLNGLNNHMEATLASYNAGRTRAVKWLAFENYREPAEFVETIPFNETRDYVQAVIRNGSVYRRLYEGRPIEVTSTDEYARQQPAPPVSKPAATKKSAAKVSQRKNR